MFLYNSMGAPLEQEIPSDSSRELHKSIRKPQV